MRTFIAVCILLLSFQSFASFPEILKGQDIVRGETVELKPEGAGRVVLFLSAKCPCSDSHLAVLKRLAAEYKNFRFVGIHANADEPAELSKKYFSGAKLPFPVLQDEHATWANELKALKTPHVFVLNAQGQILYQGGVTDSATAGTANKNYLADALSQLTSGREVKVKMGRTLGCIIARDEDKNAW